MRYYAKCYTGHPAIGIITPGEYLTGEQTKAIGEAAIKDMVARGILAETPEDEAAPETAPEAPAQAPEAPAETKAAPKAKAKNKAKAKAAKEPETTPEEDEEPIELGLDEGLVADEAQ
ncbi:MAG: hypothetical protein IJ188_06425 [Clostridia bacterium]|nr:hypothetical protein [Clostridia bacterium]